MKRACLYVFIFLFAAFLGWLGVQQSVPPFHETLYELGRGGIKGDLLVVPPWQEWVCKKSQIDLPIERLWQCFSPNDEKKDMPGVMVRFVGAEEPFLVSIGADYDQPPTQIENFYFTVKTAQGWRFGERGALSARIRCYLKQHFCRVTIFGRDKKTVDIETEIAIPEGVPLPSFEYDHPQYSEV